MKDARTAWAESAWQDCLKRRKRRNRGRIATCAAVAIVLAALLVLLVSSRSFPGSEVFCVRSVDVSGNRSVSEQEIARLAGVTAGRPWWGVHVGQIREDLAADPRLESVNIRYDWFHRIRIEVTEREGVLGVLSPPGAEVTADGWLLSTGGQVEPQDLPILRSAPGSTAKLGERVDRGSASVAAMMARLRRERPGLWGDVSEIELTSNGEGYVYLRHTRSMIRFIPGANEDLWSSVPGVLDDLQSRGCDDAVLDLRFERRIVVHLPEALVPDSSQGHDPRSRA